MTYNKDTTIEVGDLVRVVNSCLPEQNDYEFAVDNVSGIFIYCPKGAYYYAEELEIMTPKAALESVYEEEKKLEEKKDKCYSVCWEFYSQETSMDRADLEHKIINIFND